MLTDDEIRIKGMDALIDALGLVDAERFVMLVNRERFDYTEWRKNLWSDKTVEEISRAAMEFQKGLEESGVKKTKRATVTRQSNRKRA